MKSRAEIIALPRERDNVIVDAETGKVTPLKGGWLQKAILDKSVITAFFSECASDVFFAV